MAKGMKGYEQQGPGGYTSPKCSAEGKPVTQHGGRGVLQDGKVSIGVQYPAANATGKGKPEAASKTKR